LRRSFIFLEVGGTAGMKASFFFKNDAELSEIIMEINDLRRVACAPDRPEQDRRRFCNRAFRR
jgi:hypothetical protein